MNPERQPQPLPLHTDIDEASQRGSSRAQLRPMVIALAITAGFMIVEAIGGYLTHSLALLADAGHMATDVAALMLSLFAIWLAKRPATPERSFGFARTEVLAAVANSATLIAVSLYIFWEAIQRLGSPPEVDSGPMILVAIAGLVANLVSAWVLSRGGGHQHNLNTRGAFLHVISDALGSVGAIVAAIIMLTTNWYLADPLLSGGIGLLILWNSWRLLRESINVLMEATPEDIDPSAVASAAMSVDGVTGLHDLHIWTVTSGLVAASAHVEIEDFDDWARILQSLNTQFRAQFGIAHATLQPEPSHADHEPDDFSHCTLDTIEGRTACLAEIGRTDTGGIARSAHAGHRH